MNESICVELLGELYEAHDTFEGIINEMKDNNIIYRYDELIAIEKSSYRIVDNAITKMDEAHRRYNLLKEENKDFFISERRIIIRDVMLYVFSIIMIKIFSKTLSAEKLSEIWYALLGMTLGTVNMGIINKHLNEYRNSNKNNRNLMNDLCELKAIYDDNFEIARREVSYMFSLNRNLQEEIPEEKIFIKKKNA